MTAEEILTKIVIITTIHFAVLMATVLIVGDQIIKGLLRIENIIRAKQKGNQP
jgi:hypothetical protein